MPGDAVHKSFSAIGGKRSFELKEVPVGKVYFPPRSHVLWHPRGEREPDPKVVASIDEKGFIAARAPVVWRQVAEGGEVTLDGTVLNQGEALCIVIYGSRRSKALFEVQQRRRASGLLKKHEELLLPVFFFSGSEGDALLLREEEDGDPLKEPHSPGVVAHTFRMAKRCGKTVEDMMRVAPRDYQKATVSAMLRWEELIPEVAEALDKGVAAIDGREYSTFINVLAPLLDEVPRARQVEMFYLLTKDRKRSVSSARTFLRQWFASEQSDHEADELDQETDSAGDRPSRRAPPPPPPVEGADGDPARGVPDFDEDGPFGKEPAEASSESDDENEDDERGKVTAPPPPRARPQTGARSPVQRTSRAVVRRVFDLVAEKPKPTKVEHAFAIGARLGLGRDEAGQLVKGLDKLSPELMAMALGGLFRLGVWGPAVQRLADGVGGGVPELVEAARAGKAKPSEPEASAKKPRGRPRGSKNSARAK